MSGASKAQRSRRRATEPESPLPPNYLPGRYDGRAPEKAGDSSDTNSRAALADSTSGFDSFAAEESLHSSLTSSQSGGGLMAANETTAISAAAPSTTTGSARDSVSLGNVRRKSSDAPARNRSTRTRSGRPKTATDKSDPLEAAAATIAKLRRDRTDENAGSQPRSLRRSRSHRPAPSQSPPRPTGRSASSSCAILSRSDGARRSGSTSVASTSGSRHERRMARTRSHRSLVVSSAPDPAGVSRPPTRTRSSRTPSRTGADAPRPPTRCKSSDTFDTRPKGAAASGTPSIGRHISRSSGSSQSRSFDEGSRYSRSSRRSRSARRREGIRKALARAQELEGGGGRGDGAWGDAAASVTSRRSHKKREDIVIKPVLDADGKPVLGPNGKPLMKKVRRIRRTGSKAGDDKWRDATAATRKVPQTPLRRKPGLSEGSLEKTPLRRNTGRVPRKRTVDDDDDVSVMSMEGNEFEDEAASGEREKLGRVPRVRYDKQMSGGSGGPMEYEFDSEPEHSLLAGRRNHIFAGTSGKGRKKVDSNSPIVSQSKSMPGVSYIKRNGPSDRTVASFDVALARAEEAASPFVGGRRTLGVNRFSSDLTVQSMPILHVSERDGSNAPAPDGETPSAKPVRRPTLRRQGSNNSFTSTRSSLSITSLKSCITAFQRKIHPKAVTMKASEKGLEDSSSHRTEQTTTSDVGHGRSEGHGRRRAGLGARGLLLRLAPSHERSRSVATAPEPSATAQKGDRKRFSLPKLRLRSVVV